jgi:G3E family GTPase
MSDFTNSLYALLEEVQPEAVILEATGLADPVAIGELLQANALKDNIYLSHVWCVVDLINFPKVYKTVNRISQQIRVADTIVLNKMDKFAGDLQTIEQQIKSLNPFAQIRTATFCEIMLNDAFAEFTTEPVVSKRTDELAGYTSSGRPDLGSAVIRSNKRISKKNLETFLSEQQQNAYRLKGYVNLDSGQTITIQSCFGETKIIPYSNYVGPTEIIAIGPKIVAGDFSRRFRALVG